MNRKLDVVDVLVAGGLAASTVLWAFVWAAPYPHPDLWPFLADIGDRIPLKALALFGKVSLGAFAGLAYLILRGAWIRFRDREDELPDRFFFTRFCPLCGAAVFALSSPVWRAAQFLSPDFALVTLAMLAVFLWQCGCGYRHLTLACAAYLMLSFVAGMHPLGIPVLAYVAVCDAMRRWQSEQEHGQREDDSLARRRRGIERTLSIFAGLAGFGCSVHVAAKIFADATPPSGLAAALLAWWRGWFAAAQAVFQSYPALALVVGVSFAAAALALGRRLRAYGRPAFALSVALTVLLALLTVLSLVRAVDSDERVRLALMRDYVSEVLADAEGAEWLFTDGRFDDVLRFEANRRGMKLCVLNALVPPTKGEADRLRTLAPEPADVDLFGAGGAEVFKAWARERPERLVRAAWQLGSGVVRRFGKIRPQTSGTVMRADGRNGAEADRRFIRLTRDVRFALEHPCAAGGVLVAGDEAVSRCFDGLLWRAARMAGERADAAARAGNTTVAQTERETMQALDAANGTLRAQGNAIERLLPTANLVLTAKESLEIALKRADFTLAQRFAREVLVSAPDDPQALFALGMANLEAGEYFNAMRYLERVLRMRPEEPATLNNLSLAYLRLGKLEEAKAAAERALKANPQSAEIRRNLAAILKEMK